MEITEDERILFRHTVDYYEGKTPKEKFAKGPGDLVITSHRIFFQSGDGGIIFETVWSNVRKDQYSPPSEARVMFLLGMYTATATNDDNALFLLTGRGNLHNSIEDLKRHVKNNLEVTKKRSSGSSSSNSHNKVGDTTKFTIEERLNKHRVELLEADKELKKEYQDLVINEKIMSDEEFWFSKKNAINESMLLEDPVKRGRLLKLYSDLDPNDPKIYKEDGTINIDTETIDDIFRMYPAVYKAYDALVPQELTEQEFWDKYIQSEYYAKDKAGRAKISALGSRSDDIIEKYATGQVELERKGRLDVDKEVDLVAHAEDHRGNEDIDAADRGYKESGIVQKYNRHSTLFIDDLRKTDDNADGASAQGRRKDKKPKFSCDELCEQQLPEYTPLNMQRNIALSEGSVGYDEEKSNPDSNTQDKIGRRRKLEEEGEEVNYPFISERYQRGIKMFRTKKISWDLFKSDKECLTDYVFGAENGHAVNTNELQSEESIRRIGQLTFDVSSTLPDHFRAETLEAFKRYSELLRHFFSILSRTGDQAATSEKSALKVDKILERLQTIGESLKRMKNKISIEASSDGQQFNAAAVNAQIMCIGDVLKLHDVARDVWNRHKKMR